MALMGFQLWQLSGALMFILCALALQILLTIVYTFLWSSTLWGAIVKPA